MENEACGFSDFDRGAMRQKMAIFKEGNSVWRGTKNFEWRNFHEFHRGTMRQKMAIFKEGNSVCRGPKFCKGRCWWKSSFYWRKIGRTLPNFEYFWMGAMLMKIIILWNFEYFSIGAMLLKIVILSMEKWSHMDKFFNGDMLMKINILVNYCFTKKIGRTWPHFMNLIWSGNDARRNDDFQKRNNIWRGTNVFSCGRCSWKSSFYWWKIDRTWPNFDIKILSSDDNFCVQLNFRW